MAKEYKCAWCGRGLDGPAEVFIGIQGRGEFHFCEACAPPKDGSMAARRMTLFVEHLKAHEAGDQTRPIGFPGRKDRVKGALVQNAIMIAIGCGATLGANLVIRLKPGQLAGILVAFVGIVAWNTLRMLRR